MKSEEKQIMKVIQLTNTENKSLWKTKDDGMVLMSNMSEQHLQAALVTVQSRQQRSFDMLSMDFRLEQKIKDTAKSRGLSLLDYEEATKNSFSKKYKKNKSLLKQLAIYLKRKKNESRKERAEA